MRNDLRNVKKVRINDYSEYKEGKSNNGGCYGFWTTYKRTDGEAWEVSYGTTSDFDYCPCCGNFGSHYNYEDEIYECGSFEIVSTEELEKIIESFEQKHSGDEDYFVDYI